MFPEPAKDFKKSRVQVKSAILNAGVSRLQGGTQILICKCVREVVIPKWQAELTAVRALIVEVEAASHKLSMPLVGRRADA